LYSAYFIKDKKKMKLHFKNKMRRKQKSDDEKVL
jgi:hypothetical protein